MPSNKDQLVKLAALNNAEWCSLVCEANGAPSKLKDCLWSSIYKVPIYYPNIITLRSDISHEQVRQIMHQMSGPISIKDSFNNLNLAFEGFNKLFKAKWILAPQNAKQIFKFDILGKSKELKRWVTAWSNGATINLFYDTIFQNPSVRFLANCKEDKIVAGAIANKSKEVIGLSNFFCTATEPVNYWLTCVAAAQGFQAGLPVIGYEKNEVLTLINTTCFKDLGSLSVWHKL